MGDLELRLHRGDPLPLCRRLTPGGIPLLPHPIDLGFGSFSALAQGSRLTSRLGRSLERT